MAQVSLHSSEGLPEPSLLHNAIVPECHVLANSTETMLKSGDNIF